MLGRTNFGNSGGVNIINSLVEEYKVAEGNEIKAREFVTEKIKIPEATTETIEDGYKNLYDGEKLIRYNCGQMYHLWDNKYAFLLPTDSSSNYNYSLYLEIYELENETLTKLSSLLLAEKCRNNINFGFCLYGRQVVVVASNSNNSSGSDTNVVTILCTINDDYTITLNNTLVLATGTGIIARNAILFEDKILVTYAEKNDYLYGKFITISDNQMTASSAIVMTDKSCIYYNLVNVIKCDNNHILVSGTIDVNSERNYRIYLLEIDKNNNKITTKDELSFLNSIKAAETSKYGVEIVKNNNGYYVKVGDSIKYIEIINEKIVDLTTTEYNFYSGAVDKPLGRTFYIINYKQYVVTFVILAPKTANYMVGRIEVFKKHKKVLYHIKTIDTTETNFDDIGGGIISTGDKLLFWRGSSSGKTYPVIYNTIEINDNIDIAFAAKITSEDDRILGVAKTSGNSGDTIKVYVPKIENNIESEEI